jgi:hypothetical protein
MMALSAAAELPQMTLVDALDLCELLAQVGDERYPRFASRWVQRYAAETGATLGEVQIAAGALARLGEEPGSAMAKAILERMAAP